VTFLAVVSDGSHRSLPAGFVGALVAAATVLVFVDARHNGFIHVDDPYYLTQNPWVRLGLTAETARYALTSRDVWNWHPLTWWSHLLDVELFGVDAGAHHLVSVALHAAAAVVVLTIARQLGARPGVAVFVALAFALHPQRVESVVWLSERKDILCTLFFLAAVSTHLALRAAEARPARRRAGLRLLRLGAALAATMAKPMAVTLPFALLLLDIWPGGVSWTARALAGRLREKLELLIVAGCGSSLTLWAQERMLPVPGPFAERVGDAAWAVCCYIAEFIVPVALSFSHPRIDLRPPPAVAVLTVVVVGALVLAAVVLLPRRPALGVAWLWFVGLLFPTLGIVSIGSALYADRYTYLPSLGLIALAVFAVDAVVPDHRVRAGLGLATLALWAGLTTRLVPVWASSESLVQHSLAVQPDDGDLLRVFAQAAAGRGELDLALGAALAAERVRPNAGTADFVGQVLLRRGDRAGARAAFERAFAYDADDILTRVHLGEMALAAGQWGVAVGHLERAVALDRSRRTLLALAHAREAVGDDVAMARLRDEAALLPAAPDFRGPRGAFPDPTPGDESAPDAQRAEPAPPEGPSNESVD